MRMDRLFVKKNRPPPCTEINHLRAHFSEIHRQFSADVMVLYRGGNSPLYVRDVVGQAIGIKVGYDLFGAGLK